MGLAVYFQVISACFKLKSVEPILQKLLPEFYKTNNYAGLKMYYGNRFTIKIFCCENLFTKRCPGFENVLVSCTNEMVFVLRFFDWAQDLISLKLYWSFTNALSYNILN